MASSSFHLSERAVARIAEAAVKGVPGSISLDSKLAGLAARSYPRVEARIDRGSSTASVNVEMAVTYPSPVVAVTDTARAAVTAHVRELTGLDVSTVNITVADARPARDSADHVTADDVARYDVTPDTTPITVHPSTVTSPHTAPERELTPVVVAQPVTLTHPAAPRPTQVRTSGFSVEPRPLSPVAAPEPVAMREVVVTRGVDTPRSVTAPPPTPVVTPRAPQPKPLRRISVNPTRWYQ